MALTLNLFICTCAAIITLNARGALQELGVPRSDLVVTTKIFWGGQGPNDKGLSRKHIIEGTRVSFAAAFWVLAVVLCLQSRARMAYCLARECAMTDYPMHAMS